MADLRKALRENLVNPLNLVLLTRDRIEEVVAESVERGRMTANDAQQIVQGLVEYGRQQTNEVLANLEGLLGRSKAEAEATPDRARAAAGEAAAAGARVAGGARKRAGSATGKARKGADPIVAQADRARRVAGVGPSFPILGYDDLTVDQVRSRLDALTAPELRKVRDYEKRNANRKSVLQAVETKLT